VIAWLTRVATDIFRWFYVTFLVTKPDYITPLTNLRVLNLSGNNLSELPNWIAQLTNLHQLYLDRNELSNLSDWIVDSNTLPFLNELYISRNPLKMPSVEVLGEALVNPNVSADLDAIRDYFRQFQGEEPVYFYEAKLLIVGEDRAGKTSLARKLQEPTCSLLPEEESTRGIDILTWNFDLPHEMPGHNEHYKVNIWDFGGQEMYFATHQI